MAGIKEELSARHQELTNLLTAGKNKEASEYVTEDFIMMPPGSEVVRGREGYVKFAEASAELASKVSKSEYSEDEVFGDGDLVTSRSKGIVYGKDGNVLVKTKACVVWKKVDGKWLMHQLIWNTDTPFSF